MNNISVNTSFISALTSQQNTNTNNIASSMSELTDAITTKQDIITDNTDLTCNSLTTIGNLTSSGNTKILGKNTRFDTIVIRRVSNNDTMNLREIQLWVNDVNILIGAIITSKQVDGDPLGETTEFFNNNTNLTERQNDANRKAHQIANGLFYDTEHADIVHSVDTGVNSNTSLYIPMTISMNIHDIQSIVLYNRQEKQFMSRVIGLRIELYNRVDDPTLSIPLVFTNKITTTQKVYRFDFPAIDDYNGGFISADSMTQIVSNTYAITEVVDFEWRPTEITGDVVMSDNLTIGGALTVGDDINVETSLNNLKTSIGTIQAALDDLSKRLTELESK